MLKLIIVDDERVIRESINNLIDWKAMGIQVVGLCKNGLEAYDMIMDENPDIVMTDIRMPGFSGLELIRRIQESNQNVEFIILSGYGEFDYAKEAMTYGVKHYLLKPSNEDQIIEVINTVKSDCLRKNAEESQQEAQQVITNQLSRTVMRSILAEGLSEVSPMTKLAAKYAMYLNFDQSEYQTLYFYYTDHNKVLPTLEVINQYFGHKAPGLILYPIYVHQTLIVFFESYALSYHALDIHFKTNEQLSKWGVDYNRQAYGNLQELLNEQLNKLRRYDVVNTINNGQLMPLYNYRGIISQSDALAEQIRNSSEDKRDLYLSKLKVLLQGISNTDFLKIMISNLILKSSHHSMNSLASMEFIIKLNGLSECEEINDLFAQEETIIFAGNTNNTCGYKEFICQIMNYVYDNLNNPGLSLKWIAGKSSFYECGLCQQSFPERNGKSLLCISN